MDLYFGVLTAFSSSKFLHLELALKSLKCVMSYLKHLFKPKSDSRFMNYMGNAFREGVLSYKDRHFNFNLKKEMVLAAAVQPRWIQVVQAALKGVTSMAILV